jgi:hypothetical protein
LEEQQKMAPLRSLQTKGFYGIRIDSEQTTEKQQFFKHKFLIEMFFFSGGKSFIFSFFMPRHK